MSSASDAAQNLALRLVGLEVVDANGARIGRVESILVDREQGGVVWLHLRCAGLIDGFLAVPLTGPVAAPETLHLPWTRDVLARAPRVPAEGALTSRQERALCAFYNGPTPGRGASLSVWERRRTAARLITPGVWEPAPRGAGGDRRCEPIDRRQGPRASPSRRAPV